MNRPKRTGTAGRVVEARGSGGEIHACDARQQLAHGPSVERLGQKRRVLAVALEDQIQTVRRLEGEQEASVSCDALRGPTSGRHPPRVVAGPWLASPEIDRASVPRPCRPAVVAGPFHHDPCVAAIGVDGPRSPGRPGRRPSNQTRCGGRRATRTVTPDTVPAHASTGEHWSRRPRRARPRAPRPIATR